MLRKNGLRISLQSQPFELLIILLENAGSVVSREELRQKLWPGQTAGDFEHGLNAAITRVRQALNDSARSPKYIETLPKRGYRFTAHVEHPANAGETEPRESVQARSYAGRLWGVLAAGILALVVVFSMRATHRISGTSQPSMFRSVPFTSFPGLESSPAVSPDNKFVAFSWNGQKQDNFDIYVMPLYSTVPVRLTTDAAADLSPAWSPDGQAIAFLRRTGDQAGVLVLVPAAGGPEQILGKVSNKDLVARHSPPVGSRISSIAWSPDMLGLAVSHREPSDTAERIYFYSSGGGKRALTTPPIGSSGDHMPAISPDGKTLAFCRLRGFGTSEIFLLSLDASFNPAGEPKNLTSYHRWAMNPTWMPDGNTLLYVFAPTPELIAQRTLRAVDVARPESDRVIPLAEAPYHVSAGRHLVYSQLTEEADIWRARIPAPGAPPVSAEVFMSSTRADTKAAYSPNGTKIVFTSERTGSPELWVANSDGSNPVRRTYFEGALVGPASWSPDGQSLAFHARLEGQADIFVIPSAGGQPTRLTDNPADDMMPSYSHDGRWIFFTSMRSGQNQIWKMPSRGGPAIVVTTGGGFRPFESPDGKSLYYNPPFSGDIMQVPVDGGLEVPVIAPVHSRPAGFAVTRQGIYYPSPPDSGGQVYIRFFSFATRQSRAIVHINRPPGFTASVSPDGKYILLEQWEDPKVDLMLVEDFRVPSLGPGSVPNANHGRTKTRPVILPPGRTPE